MKGIIFSSVCDLVVDLIYYDRKDDEELPVGAIENAVKSGDVSIDEMTELFKLKLTEALKESTLSGS